MLEIDFDALKTPIYPGINDRAVLATENKAGNASDLISRVNRLVDYTKDIYNDVYNEISNIPTPSGLLPDWIPVDVDWNTSVNESYVILPQVESVWIQLPSYGDFGHFISLVKLNPNTQVEIRKLNYHSINGVYDYSSVYLATARQIVYIFAARSDAGHQDWIVSVQGGVQR